MASLIPRPVLRLLPPLPIREGRDPFTDRTACLIVGLEVVLGQELVLQGGEKALHQGVVEAITDGPHGGMDPRCSTPLAITHRGRLRAVIGGMDQPRLWSPLAHRHRKSQPGPVQCAGGPASTSRPLGD